MISEKVDYFKDFGLGGSMFWEVFGDCMGVQLFIGISKNVFGLIDGIQNCFIYFDLQFENIVSNLV